MTRNYSKQIKRIDQMARRTLGIAASLLILFSGESALAQSEQLYFAAIESQYASLSPGDKQTAVYLRWDAVEGGVPADLAGFKIKRDGVQIGGVLSAQSVLTLSEIAALYTGKSQSRRAAEIQSALHEEAEGRLFQAAEDGIDVEDVLECHHVTGAHTLMVKVKTKSTETLEAVIQTIRSLEGVTRSETSVVLSTYVEHPNVSLQTCLGFDLRATGRSGKNRRRAAK